MGVCKIFVTNRFVDKLQRSITALEKKTSELETRLNELNDMKPPDKDVTDGFLNLMNYDYKTANKREATDG